MRILSRIIKAVTVLFSNPHEFICSIISRYGALIPDDIYLRIVFRLKMGHSLNLKDPKTFNQKLQWLKLYNRKSEFTTMVDKYAVKDYVSQIIGDKYIIPTLGVWNTFDEIDFSILPNQFVLKTTHGGGGCAVIICTDKSRFDYVKAKHKMELSLSDDVYRNNREWPYKNVPKRIIAEKYMSDKLSTTTGELKDYKFFCFNGKTKFFKIDFDRFISHRANYYDCECNIQPFGEVEVPPNFNKNIEIPTNINKMIELADKLSVGFPFLRVDFYNINGSIYFGELTFFPASGFGKFTIDEWDTRLGNLINLNIK